MKIPKMNLEMLYNKYYMKYFFKCENNNELKSSHWSESKWFKEWEELARENYREVPIGHWECYVDRYGRIHYKYVE